MIKVETTPERLESKGGLVLAGKMAQKIGLTTIKSGILACAGTIIASLYALLVQGDSAFMENLQNLVDRLKSGLYREEPACAGECGETGIYPESRERR